MIDLSPDRFRQDPDWPRLVEKISNLGTGSRDVFGADHKLLGGHMIQQDVLELTCLVMALRELGGHRYLEIGSASGGTAKLLHEEVGFDKMVSIDLPQGDVHALKLARFAEFPITWTELDSTSYDALKWLTDNDLGPFDVIFIDGDHHRNGILRDILMYRAFAAHNAVMAFHDTVVVNDAFGVRIALDLCYRMGVLQPLVQYRGHTPNLGIDLAWVR